MNVKMGEATLGVTPCTQSQNPFRSDEHAPTEHQSKMELEHLLEEAKLSETAAVSLAAYIKWANQHFRHIRIYNTGDAEGVPGLQIRFDALQQDKFRPLGWWIDLEQNIEERSGDTVFATSDGSLFTKGILNLEISSQNYGYQESLVIETLEWLFDERIAD